MKISVIGYSGSGKSTLAEKLAKRYSVEVLHLDAVHFGSNWTEKAREEECSIVGEFLDRNENWVIDGNYSKVHYERRMEGADLIVVMLFNRFNALRRVIKRYRKYRGTSRPDLAEGCPEKIDLEFVKWVLFDGRSAQARRRYKDVVDKYGSKVVVLKNQRQINKFEKERGIGNI